MRPAPRSGPHREQHWPRLDRRPGLAALGSGLLACAAFLVPSPARSAPNESEVDAGRPLTSVFFIAKSENTNQVHYGIKVDEQCRPRGEMPMYAYWRDLEVGPRVTSPILKHELPAYGINRPFWIKNEARGGRVRVSLRGFPERPLIVETFRVGDQCRARALTTIKQRSALLRSIYVALGFLFSIDHVVVHGFTVPGGEPIQEKMDG
jgi:hypothetical protein